MECVEPLSLGLNWKIAGVRGGSPRHRGSCSCKNDNSHALRRQNDFKNRCCSTHFIGCYCQRNPNGAYECRGKNNPLGSEISGSRIIVGNPDVAVVDVILKNGILQICPNLFPLHMSLLDLVTVPRKLYHYGLEEIRVAAPWVSAITRA